MDSRPRLHGAFSEAAPASYFRECLLLGTWLNPYLSLTSLLLLSGLILLATELQATGLHRWGTAGIRQPIARAPPRLGSPRARRPEGEVEDDKESDPSTIMEPMYQGQGPSTLSRLKLGGGRTRYS